jgi:chromosome partitioning protein
VVRLGRRRRGNEPPAQGSPDSEPEPFDQDLTETGPSGDATDVAGTGDGPTAGSQAVHHEAPTPSRSVPQPDPGAEVAVDGEVGAGGVVEVAEVTRVDAGVGTDEDETADLAAELVAAAGAIPVTDDGGAAEPDAGLSLRRSRSARSEDAATALIEQTEGRGVAAFRPLPRVIAVANQKGGVGKTTTTVNLGAALAELGYRTLVIDLDPQGNATTGLGIDARNFEHSMYDVIMHETPLEDCVEPTSVRNLFAAPATIDLAGVEIELVPAFSRELRLRRAIETVLEDFEFILVDCPPSLGLITINGLAAASEVLVPIQCEYYALEGLGQLLRNVHLVASNLNDRLEVSAIVLTMYDARTRLAVDVAGEVRQHFGDKVCRIMIPRTVRLSEAPSFGQPITVFDPSSRGAVAYRELAKEVSNGAAQRPG